jgi:hypothetical protein
MPLTSLSAVSLGIVGNAAHKSGYHLGRDRIFGPDGQASADYSVKSDRDKDFVTTSASALDIGSFGRLRQLSVFIVDQGMVNAPDTHDIREVIYSEDGIKVLRWDRERGFATKPKEEGDSSHRTHTHVSWYRDSLDRDKRALFARFFELPAPVPVPIPVPPLQGEIVKSFDVPKAVSVCTVPLGARLFDTSAMVDVAFNIDPGRDMPFLGEPFPGIALIHRTDEQGNATGKAFFVRMSELKNIRPA